MQPNIIVICSNTPENDEYNSREFIFLVHFNMDEVGTNGYSYMSVSYTHLDVYKRQR